MPGLTTHLVLAEDARQALRESRPDALGRGRLIRSAFRLGAVGPDLGYFPGGHEVLSDLAHCIRSGGLVRTLWVEACTPAERAFAAGWLTHVLADRRIHPLVGYATGEALFGQPTFVDSGRAPSTHVRVEAGLDVWFARTERPRVFREVPSTLQRRLGRLLAKAYTKTYETPFTAAEFEASLRAVSRSTGPGLRLTRQVQRASGVLESKDEGRIIVRAPTHSGVAQALGLLRPIEPFPWLRDAVGAERASFADTFTSILDNDLKGLGNENLETGTPEWQVVGHLSTERARTALEARSSTSCISEATARYRRPIPEGGSVLGA